MEKQEFLTVLQERKLQLKYLVLKVGEDCLSTTLGQIPRGTMKVQETNSVLGGREFNLWVRAELTEGKGHKRLNPKQVIELNIYFEREQGK